MRVLVAMSGGVDSSVAAALLTAAGHEVVGVTLHLWDYPDDSSVRGRCCAPEDVHDARRVAEVLGIPHFAFDRRREFERHVVTPFVSAYLGGTTPSPCVACNRKIKLAELEELRVSLGAASVATGHFARIQSVDGTPRLFRGRDRKKDQSYFLHSLSPDALATLSFPLGDLTKAEVRAEAHRLGLPGADKGESQELCFVPTGHYAQLVAARGGDRLRPGPLVAGDGRVVGHHDGIHGFTLGQRRNLGVALGAPAYVTALDPATGRVSLGGRERLLMRQAHLDEIALCDDVTLPVRGEVAVRYQAAPVAATITEGPGGGLEIAFDDPVFAVVPGQFAVLYRGERVLGGGRITSAS